MEDYDDPGGLGYFSGGTSNRGKGIPLESSSKAFEALNWRPLHEARADEIVTSTSASTSSTTATSAEDVERLTSPPKEINISIIGF